MKQQTNNKHTQRAALKRAKRKQLSRHKAKPNIRKSIDGDRFARRRANVLSSRILMNPMDKLSKELGLS